MGSERQLAGVNLKALAAVLEGDPLAMTAIASVDHDALRAAVAEAHQPLVLGRSGAVRVLKGMLASSWTPEQAQAWASFVRTGFVAGPGLGSIQPLDIQYEDDAEDEIVEVLARLDEIGDLIDGEVTDAEILEMLRTLDIHGGG